MRHALEQSIVRVCDRIGRVVGGGFVVAPRRVATCAHVVQEALGAESLRDLTGRAVRVEFPFVRSAIGVESMDMTVEVWKPPGSRPFDADDLAILVAKEEFRDEIAPARIVENGDRAGDEFEAIGFPPGQDDGVWGEGELLYRQGANWIQVGKMADYAVDRGFSGAPIWSVAAGGVVGMAVTAETSPGVRAAFVIPTEFLVQACPGIRSARPLFENGEVGGFAQRDHEAWRARVGARTSAWVSTARSTDARPGQRDLKELVCVVRFGPFEQLAWPIGRRTLLASLPRASLAHLDERKVESGPFGRGQPRIDSCHILDLRRATHDASIVQMVLARAELEIHQPIWSGEDVANHSAEWRALVLVDREERYDFEPIVVTAIDPISPFDARGRRCVAQRTEAIPDQVVVGSPLLLESPCRLAGFVLAAGAAGSICLIEPHAIY